MHKLLFSVLLLAIFCTACKQDSKTANTNPLPTTANPDLLGGNWIALDFCSRANQYGSVLQAMNNSHLPYAFAMTINPGEPDSVACFNGYKSWKLPVKYNADTLELVGARAGKSVFLVYDSQGEKDITMFDATTGEVQMDRFIKSKAEVNDGYAAFLVALNNSVLGGVFIPISKGATGEVQFTPPGVIQGLKNFDRFELCTGGDCFVAGQDIDVVTFSNSEMENSDKFFGYRFSARNDTLTIFNLLDIGPDEKAAYTVSSVAYKFLRKKVDPKK